MMHLLYARFFAKALYDMGMVDFEEPFLRLFNQGVILGQDHEKMSKSRGNVVNPDDVVGVMGADAVRCFLMFIGPWDQGGPWSGEGINGIARWLNRVWDIAVRDATALDDSEGSSSRDTRRLLHQTVRKWLQRYRPVQVQYRYRLNDGAYQSSEQGLGRGQCRTRSVERMRREASPDAGADGAPCNRGALGAHRPRVQHSPAGVPRAGMRNWPRTRFSPSLSRSMARSRDKLEVPVGIPEAEAQQLALSSPRVQSFLDGKAVNKTVYVPGRLVNVVVQ